MAYNRRRRYRRRRGRAPWYRRKYNALQLASAALRGVRYVKGMVNSEMLHLENNASTTVSSTGSIVHLTNISQGDTDSGRTGNSIFARNLMIRIITTQHASATNTFCRFILFQDNQQLSDTPPGVSDVLSFVSTISPLNSGTFGRFKVLKNWYFALDSGAQKSKIIQYYRKLWHHVRYNGSATTDIQKGGLYLLMLTSEATNVPSVAYDVRLGYHDN